MNALFFSIIYNLDNLIWNDLISEKRKPKEFKKSPPKKKTPLLKEKIKTDTTHEVIKEKKPLKSGKDWGQAANDPRKKST